MKKIIILLSIVFVGLVAKAQVKQSVIKTSFKKIEVFFTDPATGEDLDYFGKDGVISFPLTQPYQVTLGYDKKYKSILMVPGDTLIVAENHFEGKGAKVNEEVQLYQNMFYGADRFARSRETNLFMAKSIDSCKLLLRKRFEKESQVLEQFIQKNKPETLFITWAKNELLYDYGRHLMRYVWINNLKPISDTYYEFIPEFPVNNNHAVVSAGYINFMDEYFNYTLGKVAAEKKDYIAYCSSLQPGVYRDLLLCRYADALLQAELGIVLSTNLNQFKELVENEAFSQPIIARYNKQLKDRKSYELSKDSKLRSTADSTLQQFVAPYAGKVVYIDVWGTWCGPCVAAMPASNKLRSAMEKENADNVVFLYLCVQSDEQSWKSMIAKLKIGGEHLLLNDDQYSNLKQAYKITGVPHYLIVDQKGNVVLNDAMGPEDAAVKVKLTTLARQSSN
ncbi:TlpA family protein disulfide reductase [Pedobacter metabolipauper]|uniref:Thiol-disulfide isomerase/thioredoxin n=1 Tax=Pedobacter metabolipauper TaxID=425513 RepID=A0A4R6SQ91_9SPHI|nr:TlpA disulfide reductase family protein [Pedobacter metabolipauper]TDQ06921.1 thiol-disulfide isomerase/thioredoxin [Pedobacter metabolipauper]